MVGFKHRIAAGEPLIGTFLKTPHPHIVEVLATSGLDCMVIDAEHAPFDRGDIDACVMAAQLGGLPVLVRTPNSAPEQILNALDCGADGVLVPHVRSAEEARLIVASAHYRQGGRGYAGSSRAAGYGTKSMPDHKRDSAAKTIVVAQIEDAEALNAIDAIAAVEGVEALFIGRIDLTVSLGCESPDDPVVVAAVERIIAACVAAGRPVGMFVPRTADVAIWREKGATLFLLGSDHGFVREGAKALRAAAGI
jgi:staphyloferrin B biosynthesis citrate synthase